MIQLQDVSMQYSMVGDTIDVLSGLELSVDPHERVAIIGPSGSGKTTLLLLLTGLEQPTSGEVMLDGQPLSSLSRDERADLRRDGIGIVFQSFHLVPSLTAAENVALPLDIAGRRDGGKRALQMLERVGLNDRARHYPAQLSGGEQQRVALARALVHEPALLVADEPTGNLDERTGKSIIELLFSLNEEIGTTLLLVTHDPSLAARCDRSLRLENGRLHAVDSAL